MAKKATKAPSWRTLMRRAKDEDKAGKPKVAATLRKQAADMRKGTRGKAKATSPKKTEPRSEVMKRAWATRRRNKANAGHAAMDAARTEAKAVMAAAGGSYQRTPAPHHFEQSATLREPGHGEIVGGAEHQFAEEIAKLARKKGGKDAIQNMVTERIAVARAEGQQLAERGRLELSQKTHEAHCDKVVKSALATWDLAEKINVGLPASMVVSGYTIARIIDVLNRHGYRGFDGQ